MTGVTKEIANARQVGGDHYKTGGVELWDLFGPESIIFYAARYLQRWRKKNGVVDLEKALHCVQKLREKAPHHAMRNVLAVQDGQFEAWMCKVVDGADEQTIIRRLVIWWKDDVELEYAQRQIEYLIKKENIRLKLSTPKTGVGVATVAVEGSFKTSERRVPRYGEMIGPMGGHIRTVDAEATKQVNATSWPWVATDNDERLMSNGGDLFRLFYTRRGPNTWVLDPHVVSVNMLSALRHCYNPCDSVRSGWTLDIRKCPPEAREFFPDLIYTKNMKEWEELLEWQRVLYAWDEQDTKYKLSEMNRTWHVEEEE